MQQEQGSQELVAKTEIIQKCRQVQVCGGVSRTHEKVGAIMCVCLVVSRCAGAGNTHTHTIKKEGGQLSLTQPITTTYRHNSSHVFHD
jgi:hypothetical protein